MLDRTSNQAQHSIDDQLGVAMASHSAPEVHRNHTGSHTWSQGIVLVVYAGEQSLAHSMQYPHCLHVEQNKWHVRVCGALLYIKWHVCLDLKCVAMPGGVVLLLRDL